MDQQTKDIFWAEWYKRLLVLLWSI